MSGEIFIPYEEILFFEVSDNKVYAHTQSNCYICPMRMAELANMLPRSFCRTSKSGMINVMKIRSIVRSPTGVGEVSFNGCGKRAFISRNYYKFVREIIEEIMGRVVKQKSGTSIFWGLFLIGAAVFLVLGDLGVEPEYKLAPWRIVLGFLCFVALVKQIINLRLAETVFPLAFLFMIFEPMIAHLIGNESSDLISNWTVLLAALLMTIGLKSILPKKLGGRTQPVTLLRSTVYLDGSELENAVISDNTGSTNVYISNTDAYTGDGMIRITDNIGSIRLHLPGTWNVILEHDDNIGRVSISEQERESFEQSIKVKVCDNVGSVRILFD